MLYPSSVHPAIPTVAAFAVGLAMTAGILLSGAMPSGYRSVSISAAINATDGCTALLVAYLAHGRYLRDGRLRDRFVAHGLALLGIAALLVPVASELLHLRAQHAADLWAGSAVRLAAAALIAAGALVGDRVRRVRAPRAVSTFGPLLFVALLLVLARMAGPSLPAPLRTPGEIMGSIGSVVQPTFAALQVVGAAGFALAALAFARHHSVDDDLVAAMGPAFAFGTVALLNYALFPSMYTDWLYIGDVFRTICYLLLLIGAAIEIKRYWTGRTRAAVLEDRRRLAREIHDGVVQEVAYIRMKSRLLGDGGIVAEIEEACDRALDEARDAVHALASSNGESLERQLQRTAHDLSRRLELSIDVHLPPEIEASVAQQHAVVRIVREAITNAARHGRARKVDVRLRQEEDRNVLEVSDDGQGFDVVAMGASAGGFGLRGMRERAESLPGEFRIVSVLGGGTTVQVTW